MARRTTIPTPQSSSMPKGGFRHSDQVVIPEAALTFREKKVLAALRAAGEPMAVRTLARRCFPGMRSKPDKYVLKRAGGVSVRHGTAAAYRCVLNSLRRLVAGGFVQKVERGTYDATAVRSKP